MFAGRCGVCVRGLIRTVEHTESEQLGSDADARLKATGNDAPDAFRQLLAGPAPCVRAILSGRRLP
jgi:hypothetical protein